MEWTSEMKSNAIQAGGGIASSLINVIGQSYINRQNIEEQRRAQAVAQQNWREQQEYNSPINQVARIERAGLNPDMLYGQSSAGVAGNAAAPAQSINPPVLNPIQLDPMLAANIFKNIAEIEVDKSQKELNEKMAGYIETQDKTEKENLEIAKIEKYIKTQTQDYVVTQIKDESITAYINRIKARLGVTDAFAESLVKVKALGLPFSISENGEINIKWKSIDKSYFKSENFINALTAYVTSNYKMPLEKIRHVQETIKTLITEQTVNRASASNLLAEEEVFGTTSEKQRYEKLVEFADFYAKCVDNGISIDWSKNPPEILRSPGGVVLKETVDNLISLVGAIFGVSLKKTF